MLKGAFLTTSLYPGTAKAFQMPSARGGGVLKFIDGKTLHVAMYEPLNHEMINFIEQKTGMTVVP